MPHSNLSDFIFQLPKAELHVHIEGTLEPSMVRSLAARNNLSLPPTLQQLDSAPEGGYAFHDLTSFLSIYYPAMSVLITEKDFHDLCFAYLTKCAAQNVLHTEIFFDAQAHTGRGVPFSTIIEGLHSAVVRAEKHLEVSAKLILCFLRDKDPDWAMATLVQSLAYKDKIVGVGLDSDERDHPPAQFANVFARARKEGFKVTCHCDIDQKHSIEHIRQAVREIKVDRIDHGTNIVEDPDLVKEVKKRAIGLTTCPISNSVVTTDWKGREIRELFDEGVKVTVNSDDPAYFRGYVNECLEFVVDGGRVGDQTGGGEKDGKVEGNKGDGYGSKNEWTKSDLVVLQRNAFEIAWVSEDKRKGFMRKLDAFARAEGCHPGGFPDLS